MATAQEIDLLGLTIGADPQSQPPLQEAAEPNFLTATVDLRLRRPNDNEANYAYFDMYHTPIQCGYNKDTSTIHLTQFFDEKDEGFFLRYIIPTQDITITYDQERAITVGAIELLLEATATIFHETSYGSVTRNQKANSLWIDFVRTLPEAHLPQQTKFSIKPKPGDRENRKHLITIMKELGIEDVFTSSHAAEASYIAPDSADTPAVIDDDFQDNNDIWSGLDLLTISTATDRLAAPSIEADNSDPAEPLELAPHSQIVENHKTTSLESFPDMTTSHGSGYEAGSHPISGPSWITSADISSMPKLPERVVSSNLVPTHPWKPRNTVYNDGEPKQYVAAVSDPEEEKLKRLEDAAKEFWEQQHSKTKQEYWTKVDTKYSSVPRAKDSEEPVEDEEDFARAWKKIKMPGAGATNERSSHIRGETRQDRGQRARGYGGRGGRPAAGPGGRGRGAYSGSDPFNLCGGRGGNTSRGRGGVPSRGRGRGRVPDRGRKQTSSTKRQSTFGGDGYYEKGYYERNTVMDDSVEMNRLMRSGVATYHDIDC